MYVERASCYTKIKRFYKGCFIFFLWKLTVSVKKWKKQNFVRKFYKNFVYKAKAKLADDENAFQKVLTCHFSLLSGHFL